MRPKAFQNKATLSDVALRAGVSTMSVSRAVRGIEGVSETTRRKILEAASDLGYQPNFNARSLAMSKSRLIGIILPTLFDEVFADILDGVRSVLERDGYDLIVETSSYDLGVEEGWVERIMKWSPAGLILTGGTHRSGLSKRIRAADVPVVEIWDARDNPIDVCVGIDHCEAGKMAADHLLECGYRNACLIGISEGRDPRAEKRFRGFCDRFSAQGLTTIYRVDQRPSYEAGHAAVCELHDQRQLRFDSYFFLNDHLAFGGLCALEALGVDVPHSAGVVGFNNLGINKVLNRRITTIETPRKQMGLVAGQRLLARIHGSVTEPVTILKPGLRQGMTTDRFTTVETV